jgi:hypothetical protein
MIGRLAAAVDGFDKLNEVSMMEVKRPWGLPLLDVSDILYLLNRVLNLSPSVGRHPTSEEDENTPYLFFFPR